MRAILLVAAALLIAPLAFPAAALAPPDRVQAGALGRVAALDEAAAREVLAARGAGGVDLAFEGLREGLALRSARFHQTANGLPVEGTRAQVTVDRENVVRWVVSDVERDVVATPCWGMEAKARAAALARMPGELWSDVTATHLVNHLGETVWRIHVPLYEPFGAWKVEVSCAGDVVRVWNAARAYDEGGPHAKIFPVSPIVAAKDPDFRDNPAGAGLGLEALLMEVEIRGLSSRSFVSGPAGLNGEYAWIVGGLARGTDDFTYDRLDPRFEEVNTYFYVDWAQRHIQSLGFDHIHNHSATIVPRLPGAYSAFYTGDPQAEMWFGWHGAAVTLLYGVEHIVAGKGGLADAGEDAHVIMHEYGHAVLDYQAGICCTEESGAMHEAFGDWMSVSLLTRFNNGTADGCMGPWFGSYLFEEKTGEFPCYRNLVNEKTMDDWKVGDDAHFNQLIWSGALWKTETKMMERDGREAGAATFERLMYEANFLLPQEVVMKDNVKALLVADAAQNGAANYDLIAEEFVARKIIAPDELPVLADLVAMPPIDLAAGDAPRLAVPGVLAAASALVLAIAAALGRR